MMLCYKPKFRMDERYFNFWEHHRNSWRNIYTSMSSAFHSDKASITFINCLDWVVPFGEEIQGRFVGMLHNVPNHPKGVSEKYERNDDLERFLASGKWEKYKDRCLGIYVLSEYSKRYLEDHVPFVVEMLWHPCALVSSNWNFNNRIVYVGHWMRKYDTFFKMETDFEKVVLNSNDNKSEFQKEMCRFDCSNVSIKEYLKDNEFDAILSESVVFVELYDASACNTVMDCIMKSIPLLINPLPAVVEYLGVDYPFYYKDHEEAAEKLADGNLRERTRNYLLEMDKSKFTISNFIRSIHKSLIYKNLISSPL
jgi:hypothetical protein